MKKVFKLMLIILTIFISIIFSACFHKYEIDEQNITIKDIAKTQSNNVIEKEQETKNKRKDGERFQSTIMLEGLEEVVNYEHLINDTIGFEMDYDYDSFSRISKSDKEIILPNYDDSSEPTNFLEIFYDNNNADTVVSNINTELSKTYDTTIDYLTSNNLGNYIHIDVSLVKNGQLLPVLRESFVIPLNNGCLVATAHYYREAAEGIGRRFADMINTMTVIDKK